MESDRWSGSPVAPAGIVAIAAWVAWGWLDGGYAPQRLGWLGAGLIVLVGLTALVVPPNLASWERRRWIAVTALPALAGWALLSILWADFPGDAWIGADRILVYAACFALFAAWPWTARALVALLGLFSLGVAAVGAIVLVRAAIASDASEFFLEGRLLEPVGYPNGNVALWMSAFWPAIALGSSPAVPLLLRVLFLPSATLLLSLALLGQSRAWLLLMPIVAVVALLLARQRLRLLLGAAIAAVPTAAIAEPLLDIRGRLVGDTPDITPFASTPALIGAACAAAALAAAAFALADRRVRIAARAHRILGVVVATLLVVAAIGSGVAVVAAADDPGGWISERWDEFTGGSSADFGESRFSGSFATGRYDEWRVAWAEFVDHPVTGIGADNYAAPYLERRDDDYREPKHPHSLELMLLSQFGIVGAALFVAFAITAVWLALERRRRLDAVSGQAVGAALMVFVYWFVYGSQDWFLEIPALAAPALGLLGLAGAVSLDGKAGASADDDQPTEPETGPAVRPARRGALTTAAYGLAIAAVVVLAASALVLPALAAGYAEAGTRGWGTDPDLAVSRLERAADLNPLSAEPLLLQGSIALRLGDEALARQALNRALEREPKNWYAYFQLALLDGSLGDYSAAGERLAQARELNPNDRVARRLAELIDRRRPIDPVELNQRYLDSFRRRFPGALRPPELQVG
jgi:hypothetical protein